MDVAAAQKVVEFFGSIFMADLPTEVRESLRSELPSSLLMDVSNERLSVARLIAWAAPPPEVFEFLIGVPHLQLRRDYAERLISYDRWWDGFPSLVQRVQVLYAAERFEDVNTLFLSSSSSSDEHKQVRHLWLEAISKLGRYWYSGIVPTPRTTQELLGYLRDCWQRADLDEALRIIEHLETAGLSAEERCRLLNQKIRVQRDLGDVQGSRQGLEQYRILLATMRDGGVAPPSLTDHEAKYHYNVAIDKFISGHFRQCIALCEASLKSRIDRYSIPYLQSRIVRAATLIGDRAIAQDRLQVAKSLAVDQWGASLIYSIEAEVHFFLLRQTREAEGLWEVASEKERATGGSFRYSELGLGYCAIALADSGKMQRSIARLKDSPLVEARICTALLQIAEGVFSGACHNLRADLDDAWHYFGDYPAWLYYGIIALARGMKERRLRYRWPSGVANRFGVLDFEVRELEEMEMARTPKAFISYSRDSVQHGDWCLRLYKILREHGVDAIIDEAAKGFSTVDFDSFMIKGVRDSDVILVVLTPKYKQKIESETGGAFNEFGMLRAEILDRNFSRIVFVLREGNFSTTCPFEARGVEQIDMRQDDLVGNIRTDECNQLIRRVLQIPTIEPVPIGTSTPPPSRKISI